MQKNDEPSAAQTDAPAREFWVEVKRVEQPIGEGGRVYYPYALRGEVLDLAGKLDQPLEVYDNVLGSEENPFWREVALFLVASVADARADDILIRELDNPETRARVLYLLGVIGSKGWPSRSRDNQRILDVLTPHLDDATLYRDVYYKEKTLQTGDFAKAAFIRIAGVEHFPEVQGLEGLPDDPKGRFIGTELPTLTDGDRGRLRQAIARFLDEAPETK